MAEQLHLDAGLAQCFENILHNERWYNRKIFKFEVNDITKWELWLHAVCYKDSDNVFIFKFGSL